MIKAFSHMIQHGFKQHATADNAVYSTVSSIFGQVIKDAVLVDISQMPGNMLITGTAFPPVVDRPLCLALPFEDKTLFVICIITVEPPGWEIALFCIAVDMHICLSVGPIAAATIKIDRLTGKCSETRKGGVKAIADTAVNAFMSFSQFMGIKNICLMRDSTAKIQKRSKQFGDTRLAQYSVYSLAVVKPTVKLAKRLYDAGEVDCHRLTTREHFVMGHARVYTEAAPLFGKYVGTFWITGYTRGDAAKGIIDKVYIPQ